MVAWLAPLPLTLAAEKEPPPAPPAEQPTPQQPPAGTPAPAQEPAPEPAPVLPPPAIRPFKRGGDGAQIAATRTGAVMLSNAKTHSGRLSLTEGKTIRLLDLATHQYREITFANLARIDVSVEFEKKQEEWSFKEGGNDEKIYSGHFYIDRRYQVQFTFRDGATVKGYVLGTVFYLTGGDEKKQRFFLHKDERGENQQAPKDMVYVKAVVFDPPPSADQNAPADNAGQPTPAPPAEAADPQPAPEPPTQP